MKTKLLNKKCGPCGSNAKPFDMETSKAYMKEVPDWALSADGIKISCEFVFKDFVKALAFVESVADIAEAEGHHPDIHIRYNRVLLELWTHSVKGLSENDFIVAAKVNEIKLK